MAPGNWKRNKQSNYDYRWDKGTDTVILQKVTSQGDWKWQASTSGSVGGWRVLGTSDNFQTARSYAYDYMRRNP